MNLRSNTVDAGLALFPVFPLKWVTPVLPQGTADGGLPISAFIPSGVELVIEPITGLLNSVIAVYDVVTIYVNGANTGVSKTIYVGEEGDRFLLLVAASWFKNGVNDVHYKVRRVSGNTDDSPSLKLLYNKPAPTVSVAHPASIGPGQPSLITITVGNARPHDTVTVTIGTWIITFTNPDPTKSITHTLTAAELLLIGDGVHPVDAVVRDQLTNSGVSATTLITISANTLVLPAPTVKGQTGNNFPPTQQDVSVLVPRGTLLPTDKVHVIWKGAISTPPASFTSPQRLVSSGLEVVVPRSVLAYSLGKQVEVTYVIERNGVPTTSDDLPLTILTLPVTALISPKIVEADANYVLDVTALGTSNATIHSLLWTLIEVDQSVWLSLEGEKSDGTAHNLILYSGLPSRVNKTWVTQGFWSKDLLISYLKQLGHGTQLFIKFKVSMDKSNVEATALKFPDRVYTISAVALVVPTLEKVLAGTIEVLEGESTISTSLKISGRASRDGVVEAFQGSGATAVSLGKATADKSGYWERPIALQLGAQRVYVKSLYHPRPDVFSNVRNFNVVANSVPQLLLITDSGGVEIPHNGTTIGASIIVSGVGAPNTTLDLVNGGGPIAGGAEFQVDGQGKWKFELRNLVVGTYDLRAKRKDGPVSNARSVIVVAVVVPTIIKVTENTATGAPVANGGSTTATTLVIAGKASAGQQVQVLKGTAVITTLTVGPTGDYSYTHVDPTLGARSYSVRGLYGASPVSDTWEVIVIALIVPSLINVLNTRGIEVQEGKSTTSTMLTVKGNASRGRKVEIFEGTAPSAVSKGTANAHETTGAWERAITVQKGARRVFAKSLYHTGDVVSNARTFKVIELDFEDFEEAPEGQFGSSLKLDSGLVLSPPFAHSFYIRGPTAIELNPTKALRIQMSAVNMSFGRPIKTVSMRWNCSRISHASFIFYNNNGGVIHGMSIESSGGGTLGWSAPSGDFISKISISCIEGVYVELDDVRWS